MIITRLPKWTESVFGPGTDFEWAANRYLRSYSTTPEIFKYTYGNYNIGMFMKVRSVLIMSSIVFCRPQSGYLIREIFDQFTAKIDGTLSPNRTVYLYSAHDMNIASILNIFGLFGQFGYRAPPYASSLHFDLYKTKENQHYMQLTYRYDNEPKLLRFPACGTRCSMEDLRRMYKELLPIAEFEKECRLPFHIRLLEGYSIFGPDDGEK